MGKLIIYPQKNAARLLQYTWLEKNNPCPLPYPSGFHMLTDIDTGLIPASQEKHRRAFLTFDTNTETSYKSPLKCELSVQYRKQTARVRRQNTCELIISLIEG